jgi:hypothetical protein
MKNCKECNFVSPITGIELISGGRLEFIGFTKKENGIYKKYKCSICGKITEVLR